MPRRTDKSLVAEWWWTIDRYLLAALIILMVIGVVLSFAASPPVATRIGIEDAFHFVKRHGVFLIPAIVVLIATSFLTPRQLRRAALLVFVVGLLALVATLFLGQEVKGSRRWLSVAGLTVQASEFVKPAFIILVAWLFSEHARRPEIPGNLFAIVLLGIVVSLLVAQPDFGQTMLVAVAWCAVFFVAGMSWWWIASIAVVGVGGVFLAYVSIDHVASRINRFLDPDKGDTYQVDRAIDSFLSGGWLGRGPGEGTVKDVLPDSHTDFAFAVFGEEFGIIVTILLVSMFAFVVLRGLAHASREEDGFVRLATVGLLVLFGIQAAINMSVNLHLIPAKGMTLPFISYGGSSMIAVAFGMGSVLSLTRRRATQTRFSSPIGLEPINAR